MISPSSSPLPPPPDIQKLKVARGLALTDILTSIFPRMLSLQMPSPARIVLLQHLADIEYNLASACNERIQLGALVAAFRSMVDMTASHATAAAGIKI